MYPSSVSSSVRPCWVKSFWTTTSAPMARRSLASALRQSRNSVDTAERKIFMCLLDAREATPDLPVESDQAALRRAAAGFALDLAFDYSGPNPRPQPAGNGSAFSLDGPRAFS